MNIQDFYGLASGVCFTLVGLWWNVVRARPEWRKDSGKRQLASGVYLSFLIPALTSMVASLGGDIKIIWRITFFVAGVMGIYHTLKLIGATSAVAPKGSFHKNRWGILVLYVLIIIGAIFPNAAGLIGLAPLQLEGILLAFLILIAHGLTWELMIDVED